MITFLLLGMYVVMNKVDRHMDCLNELFNPRFIEELRVRALVVNTYLDGFLFHK